MVKQEGGAKIAVINSHPNVINRCNMATNYKTPLSERPPKRKAYERPRGGRITPVIMFRDGNQVAKKQHTSGIPRKGKIKPVICEICGERIPETEIKTQRKNRKFHKACNPNHGKPKTNWKELHGENFINTFDEKFNLKPIEVK